MTENLDHLQDWIGRSETAHAVADAGAVDGMAATLDRDVPPAQPGDPVPPGWQLLFFREAIKLRDTGPDGHPRRGDFLPPVPLPRRMWAGNRMVFHRPLRVGEALERVSTIADVAVKDGRSGRLVFVTVDHRIAAADMLAIEERHTIVYRDEPRPGEAPPPPKTAPADPLWRRTIHPSPVLLFRFSALTMISHRIHYDRDYTTKVEGYPGLLVHGPLTAILLLDLLAREAPDAAPAMCDIRAAAPLFDIADFSVEGRPAEDGASAQLWARGPGDVLSMTAEVTFAT